MEYTDALVPVSGKRQDNDKDRAAESNCEVNLCTQTGDRLGQGCGGHGRLYARKCAFVPCMANRNGLRIVRLGVVNNEGGPRRRRPAPALCLNSSSTRSEFVAEECLPMGDFHEKAPPCQ